MADKKNDTKAAGQTTVNGGAARKRRKKLTKLEAVRKALVALGDEAARADIQGYVRQKFGFSMGLDHISNCKSELARRAAKNTAAPAPAPRTRAGGNGSSGDAVRLQDVLLVKELLDRVGAGPLRTLFDGLAK